MPLEGIGEGFFGGIIRFIAWFFRDALFELAIKGTGYLLLKLARPRSQPDESTCAIVGLAFWVLAIAALVAWWKLGSR